MRVCVRCSCTCFCYTCTFEYVRVCVCVCACVRACMYCLLLSDIMTLFVVFVLLLFTHSFLSHSLPPSLFPSFPPSPSLSLSLQLPESFTPEQRQQVLYALQNCHSVQELITCVLSYSLSAPFSSQEGLVENDQLRSKIKHLEAELRRLSTSFDTVKQESGILFIVFYL